MYRSAIVGYNALSPILHNLVVEYRLKFPIFILTLLIALATSYAAYAVRTYKRVSYGIIELAFGLGSIFYSVFSLIVAPFLSNAAGLDIWQAVFGFVAGVYIIVRGLVNIEDGLKTGPLTLPLICGSFIQTNRSIFDKFIGALSQPPHAAPPAREDR